MAGTKSRYSIGNILGAVMVMVLSGALGVYAFYDESSSRIGRNSEFVMALGVVGVLVGAGVVIAGIRSRR